mmetsp:Transcript_36353/g.55847  ORF Transcript_36353/g.55847 Transcript_36353/m.55847 type:complete len:85 (-) Transcript_36353:456-710(-)
MEANGQSKREIGDMGLQTRIPRQRRVVIGGIALVSSFGLTGNRTGGVRLATNAPASVIGSKKSSQMKHSTTKSITGRPYEFSSR